MRLKSPDQDEWKTLGGIIRYIRATQGLKLTLEANDMHVVKMWVNAAHGLHTDMHGLIEQLNILGIKLPGPV